MAWLFWMQRLSYRKVLKQMWSQKVSTFVKKGPEQGPIKGSHHVRRLCCRSALSYSDTKSYQSPKNAQYASTVQVLHYP